MPVRLYDVITFDCYGTLIDWAGGIGQAFVRAAAEDGVRIRPDAAVAAYAAIEPLVEAEAYRSYRAVLAESAHRAAATLGWPIPHERARFLPDSLRHWPAFPDTNAALERLAAAGYALAILSNVDDDLLAETSRHLTAPFEFVVTAQQVRSYKPAHGHFTEARRRIGDRRWLHAAQSYFHDVEPACELGIPVAWINRTDEQATGAARADMEFRNLSEFADALT